MARDSHVLKTERKHDFTWLPGNPCPWLKQAWGCLSEVGPESADSCMLHALSEFRPEDEWASVVSFNWGGK